MCPKSEGNPVSNLRNSIVLILLVVAACSLCPGASAMKEQPAKVGKGKEQQGKATPSKQPESGKESGKEPENVKHPSHWKVLNFPEHPVGRVNVVKIGPVGMGKRLSTSLARGTVKVPDDAEIEFDLNYQGSQEPKLFRRFRPDDLAGISFERLPVEDDFFADVSALTALKFLYLTDTEVTDRGFQNIRNLKKLEDLRASSTMITSDSLKVVRDLPNLKILEIGHNQLNDSALAPLADTKLIYLMLDSCNLSDQGLQHLSRMTSLEFLQIGGNRRITDTGISSLKGLKNLSHLAVADTGITKRSFDTFKQLPKLSMLTIRFRNFRAGDLASLRRMLPRCKIIDSDSGAGIPVEVFEPLH